MRYPPAVTFTPGVSWVYRTFVALIALILIALCAVSTGDIGHFSVKNMLPAALIAFACVWLLRDAFRRPPGSLRYAHGQWHWLAADGEMAGTCELHLDLQSYMLVSFTKQPAARSLFSKTTQWFHLEARRQDPAAATDAWLALRRALHAPAAIVMVDNAQHESGGLDLAHEKRGV